MNYKPRIRFFHFQCHGSSCFGNQHIHWYRYSCWMEGWRSQIQPFKYFLSWRHLHPWVKWASLLSLGLLPQGLQSSVESVEMVGGKRIPKFISNARLFYVMFTLTWTPIHPWKLTWTPKIAIVERKFLFQTFIFRVHVSFWECKDWKDQHPYIQPKHPDDMSHVWRRRVGITPSLLVALVPKPDVSHRITVFRAKPHNPSLNNEYIIYTCFFSQFLSVRHDVNSNMMSTQPTKQPNFMTGLKLQSSSLAFRCHGSSTTHRDWELRRSTETSSERGAAFFLGSWGVFWLFNMVILNENSRSLGWWFGAWWSGMFGIINGIMGFGSDEHWLVIWFVFFSPSHQWR